MKEELLDYLKKIYAILEAQRLNIKTEDDIITFNQVKGYITEKKEIKITEGFFFTDRSNHTFQFNIFDVDFEINDYREGSIFLTYRYKYRGIQEEERTFYTLYGFRNFFDAISEIIEAKSKEYYSNAMNIMNEILEYFKTKEEITVDENSENIREIYFKIRNEPCEVEYWEEPSRITFGSHSYRYSSFKTVSEFIAYIEKILKEVE